MWGLEGEAAIELPHTPSTSIHPPPPRFYRKGGGVWGMEGEVKQCLYPRNLLPDWLQYALLSPCRTQASSTASPQTQSQHPSNPAWGKVQRGIVCQTHPKAQRCTPSKDSPVQAQSLLTRSPPRHPPNSKAAPTPTLHSIPHKFAGVLLCSRALPGHWVRHWSTQQRGRSRGESNDQAPRASDPPVPRHPGPFGG